MFGLSPSLFSPIEWTLDEPTSHNDQNLMCKDETPLRFCSPADQGQVEKSTTPISVALVKKLNHNASERDRRRKINSFYSSLRSMLPLADQTKKLSIPAIISQVVKYIPELQEQVEGLIRKKEELLLRISKQGEEGSKECSRRKMAHHNSYVVSTSRLNDSEAVIQISSDQAHKTPFSQILQCLEKEGLLLLNVSTFETIGDKVFYNLHLQVDKTSRIEPEILSEKLLSIYE